MGLDKECWSVIIGYSLLSIGIWSWLVFILLFYIYYEPIDPDRIVGIETPIRYETPYSIPTARYSWLLYYSKRTLFELKNR